MSIDSIWRRLRSSFVKCNTGNTATQSYTKYVHEHKVWHGLSVFLSDCVDDDDDDDDDKPMYFNMA